MKQLNLSVTGLKPGVQLFVAIEDDVPNQIPSMCVMLDRWVVQMNNGGPCPPGNGLNCTFIAEGYKSFKARPIQGMPPDNTQQELGVVIEMEPSAGNFPRPDSDREPLLPVEPGDEYGNVSDTFPPEFLALPGAEPQYAHIDLVRGDAFTYETEWTAESINPICNTAWLQSIGQNTNFGNKMWYVPLLPLYPKDVQIAFYADYVRFNTHILFQAGDMDLNLVKTACDLAHAAGIEYVFVFSWEAQDFINLQDHINGAIIGLEVNKIGSDAIAAGVLDQTIKDTCTVCVPKGIRVWLHFTSNGGEDHVQSWAYPIPGMSFTNWWAQNDQLGVAGLMYESWMDYNGDMDSAGKMAAMMFYARQGLHYSSNCLVCACEIMSAPPFMGKVDGDFAYRRSTEMICASNGGVPGMVGVAGSFNGPKKWNGSVM